MKIVVGIRKGPIERNASVENARKSVITAVGRRRTYERVRTNLADLSRVRSVVLRIG